MTDLAQLKCVACRGGEPTLTPAQIADLQPQVPDWQVREVDGILRLERVFKVKDFIEAMALTTKVGLIAEKEDHHPSIVTSARSPRRKRAKRSRAPKRGRRRSRCC